MSDWISASEALSRLGVRPQTLYAYVSRGRVQATPDPAEPRRSRYRASDVAALATRKARGRKVADVAEGVMAWGEPVLSSSITTVADGRLFYRGRDAAALAETETLEGVARLLRGRSETAQPRTARDRPPSGDTARARTFAALADRAARDAPVRGRAPGDLAVEAATLIDVLADAVTGTADGGAIHERLGRAWGCGRAGMDLIRRALVLLADHELNASTFAVRVTVSTGASLSAAALAGLAALSGPLHGGVFADVALLADEARRTGPRETVAARLAHGVAAPGFGHPLYPEGDPRARALFGAFQPSPTLEALRGEMLAANGARHNVDFALAAVTEALGLPSEAPFALFAVARCAGWMAHAMEQVEGGALIRPRARYTGPAPKIALDRRYLGGRAAADRSAY